MKIIDIEKKAEKLAVDAVIMNQRCNTGTDEDKPFFMYYGGMVTGLVQLLAYIRGMSDEEVRNEVRAKAGFERKEDK